jgi:type III secretory pathway component EscU
VISLAIFLAIMGPSPTLSVYCVTELIEPVLRRLLGFGYWNDPIRFALAHLVAVLMLVLPQLVLPVAAVLYQVSVNRKPSPANPPAEHS